MSAPSADSIKIFVICVSMLDCAISEKMGLGALTIATALGSDVER